MTFSLPLQYNLLTIIVTYDEQRAESVFTLEVCRVRQPLAFGVTAMIVYLLNVFKLHKTLQAQRESLERLSFFELLLSGLAEKVCLNVYSLCIFFAKFKHIASFTIAISTNLGQSPALQGQEINGSLLVVCIRQIGRIQYRIRDLQGMER